MKQDGIDEKECNALSDEIIAVLDGKHSNMAFNALAGAMIKLLHAAPDATSRIGALAIVMLHLHETQNTFGFSDMDMIVAFRILRGEENPNPSGIFGLH